MLLHNILKERGVVKKSHILKLHNLNSHKILCIVFRTLKCILLKHSKQEGKVLNKHNALIADYKSGIMSCPP